MIRLSQVEYKRFVHAERLLSRIDELIGKIGIKLGIGLLSIALLIRVILEIKVGE